MISFLFSVFLWWFCGLWIATTSTKSRNDEGGKGWYSQTRHCESCLQLVAISVWSIILFIHGILFLFCFYIYFLWFMDCFVVSLLAMTKKQETVPPHRHCDYETVIARLCRRSENLVIETTTHNPHRTPSLRGLEKPVAISVWSTMTVKQNSSLREPKVRGNLSMGYNYLFMGFFLFSVFIFTFCGLWGFASLCKGGSCEATGGLREKLKIETQSGKMISLHNHFSLSSHEVRNERSIRN